MNRLLPFLLLLISSAVLAESGSYRVEVIIFRNLEILADAVTEEELRSFSHYPGLEQIEANEASLEIPNKNLPEDFNVITQKGAHMDGVWRRLRSSQEYRPLVYAAWDQNRVDFYPPVRVHNGEVIDKKLRPPTSIVIADLAAEDPLAAYRSTFYRLDGSVQLRRSRFLHLFLDLEFRDEYMVEEVIERETVSEGFFGKRVVDTGLEDQASRKHKVYKLRENRQIRTGRLQYFDTPYFGALVLVTALRAN